MRPVILIWRPPKRSNLWGPENFTTTDFFLNIPVSFTTTEIFTFLDVDYYNELPLNLDKNEILTFLSEDYLKPIPVSLDKSELLTFIDEKYLREIPTSFTKTEILSFIDEKYLREIPTSFTKTEILSFIDEKYLREIPTTITKTETFCLIDANQIRALPIDVQKTEIGTLFDEKYLRPIPHVLQKEEINTFINQKAETSLLSFYAFEKNEQNIFISQEVLAEIPNAFQIESSNEFVGSFNTSTIFAQFIKQSSNEFVPFNNSSTIGVSFSKDKVAESFVTTQMFTAPTNLSADNSGPGALKTLLSNDSSATIATKFIADSQLSNSHFVHQNDNEVVPAGFSISPFYVEIPLMSGPATKSSTAPDLFFYKNALHLKMEGAADTSLIKDQTARTATSYSIQLTNATRFTNDPNNLLTKAARTINEGGYINVTVSDTTFIDKSGNTLLSAYGYAPTTQDFGPFASNLGTSGYFGGNDFVQSSSAAVVATATDIMSYEFWIYPKLTNLTYPHTIFSNWAGSSRNRHYCEIAAAGNAINYTEETGSSIALNVTTPAGSIQNNTWSHVAIIRNSTSTFVKIFINGTLSAQTSTGTLISSDGAANFRIARNGDSGSTYNYFRGNISNLRVVKGAEVYTSNFNVPTSKLSVITGTQLLILQDDIDNLNLGNRDFTIEGWWNPLKLSSDGALVGIWGTNVASSSWLVSQGADASQLAFSISDGSTVTRFEAVADSTEHSPFSPLGWYHWAVVRRNNMFQGFVNGKKLSSFTGFFTGTIQAPTTSLRVATISNGTQPSFGYFDDIRVTKGIARYYDNFTPPRQTSIEPPILPLHLLHFDDTTSTQFIDDMDSNWTYYNVGAASSATITPAAAEFGAAGLSVAGGSGIRTAAAITNVLTGDFTVEAWIYPRSFNTGSVNTIVSQDLVANNGFTIYMTTSSAALSYGVNGTYQISTPFVANTWYHLAIQREKLTHTFFINGIKYVPSGSGILYSTQSTTLYLGGYTSSTNSFNGYIDELRITNYAKYTEDFNIPALAFSKNINDEDIISRNLVLYYDASNSFCYDTNNPGVASNVLNDKSKMTVPLGQNFVHATSNSFSFPCSEANNSSVGITAQNIDIDAPGDFTIELWLKQDENSNSTYSYTSTGLILPATISSNAPAAQPNVWDQIVLSRNNGVVSGYKNAELWGQGTDTSSIETIQFGTRTTGSTLDIGIFRLYNRSLSLAEISKNYDAQVDRFYRVEWLIKLEYEEAPRLFDRSAYNYPVNFIGSATVTTTDYKVGLSSLNNPNSSSGVFFEKGVVKPLEVSDFTFQTWFKQTGSVGTNSQYIVCVCPNPTSTATDASDISLSLEADAGTWKPKFSVRNNGTLTSVLSTTTVALNTWNNVAITRNGSTVYAFLNGTAFASLSGISTNFYNSSWHLGNFYKQVGSTRLGLIGRLDSTELIKNICLYTGDYSVGDGEIILPPTEKLTLSGSAVNEIDVFAIGQIDANTLFTRLISPLDVGVRSSDKSGINSILSLYQPDAAAANRLDVDMSNMPITGENAVLSLFQPDVAAANRLDVDVSNMPITGENAVLSLFQPDSIPVNVLPVSLTPAN